MIFFNINRAKNIFALAIIAALIISCVEQFSPKVEAYENSLVINGSIIKGNVVQTITISRTSSIELPDFNPVSNCEVIVTDSMGRSFIFDEEYEGIYTCNIDESYLNYGSSFSLYVKTPDNKEYVSEFETIYESSPIDSLYFDVEPKQTSSEYHPEGLQFYANLKAPENSSQRFLYDLTETYEIRTLYKNDGYWEKGGRKLPRYNPLRDSIDICWNTEVLPTYYTTTTENLSVNEKLKIPLNYIPATSTKINVRYSLLVKQHALGEKAFLYHEQTGSLTEGSESLFESQPPQAPGNITNLNDPEENVLGFFWASSYSQRRLFFDGPLTTIHDSHCDQIVECVPQIGQSLLSYFKRINRNVYLMALETTVEEGQVQVHLWAYPYNQICINCTAEGATTKKPDFW